MVLLAHSVPGDSGDELETAYGYWTGMAWWIAISDHERLSVAHGDGIAHDFRAIAAEPSDWQPLPDPPSH